MRDFQQSKVYAWEQKYIAPISKRVIDFNDARLFVNGVWLSMGLIGPPDIEIMANQATATYAVGCREYIRIRRQTPAWVIIHELGHSLTSDGHGPDFVGVYAKMLEKVLNVPLPLSMYTLNLAGVKINLAVPITGDLK